MPTIKTKPFLNTTDATTVFAVDTKTIHNWVAKGLIAHWRSPGRHLRFTYAALAAHARAFGYPMPGWLEEGEAAELAARSATETAPTERPGA